MQTHNYALTRDTQLEARTGTHKPYISHSITDGAEYATECQKMLLHAAYRQEPTNILLQTPCC